jgi:hypothetical protein
MINGEICFLLFISKMIGLEAEGGEKMDCEWIAILKRAGREIKRSEFHEADESGAIKRVEMMLKIELKERQKEFPFTEEHPANAILYRGFREW